MQERIIRVISTEIPNENFELPIEFQNTFREIQFDSSVSFVYGKSI